ncbi:hypothetical protein GCM10009123_06870 [Kangiella japonica]|uniref:Lipoprotein n=1 Tax=Kangiella japonica TaxID=647384 RepID=A0ABN0SVU3_9GAMM
MRLCLIGVFCLILSACWQQDEVISIESNGEMKWLVIAHPDWEFSSPESVEKDLQNYVAMMRAAGWSVQTKGEVKEYKDVVVGLRGNINEVTKKTDFYEIHSIHQASVNIEFLCPVVDDSRIRRSIKVKGSSASPIVCSKGVQTLRF